MPEEIAFGLFCFVTLFAMVEPVGVTPIFISMTAHLPAAQARGVARRATLVGFLTLLLFALTGQLIFRFFGVSVNSLRIVGGVLFFSIGYEMLQARLSRTTYDKETQEEESSDIALTPLGIPLIAGPGAIANVIVLWNEAETVGKKIGLVVAIILVTGATLVILLSARQIARFLGDAGNKVLLRLMGLITMVIAVEFFFAGLKPIVHEMLNPPR